MTHFTLFRNGNWISCQLPGNIVRVIADKNDGWLQPTINVYKHTYTATTNTNHVWCKYTKHNNQSNTQSLQNNRKFSVYSILLWSWVGLFIRLCQFNESFLVVCCLFTTGCISEIVFCYIVYWELSENEIFPT